MYSADDMRTPRDRISEEYIRRLLEEEHGAPSDCDGRRREEPSAQCDACDIPAIPQPRKEDMHHGHHWGDKSLAMVYSPTQTWRGIYAPETAICRGTLFRELDKPWGVENKKGGCCRGK